MSRVAGLAWVVVVGLGCGPSVGGGSDTANGDASGETTSVTSASTTVSSSTTVAETSGGSVGTVSTDGDDVTTHASDESTSWADTGSWLYEPDGGGTACFATSYCDVWAQDCPEGEKCTAWSADGDHDIEGCVLTRCAELAADPVPLGGTCTVEHGPWSGLDDCDVGAYCWDVDPATLEGVCIANCQGSEANPLCDEGLECFIGYGGWVTACLRGCDPLAPVCGDDGTCTTRDGDPSVCLPNSLAVPAAQAAGCDHTVGCGAGFVCMAADRVAGCEDPSSCCTAVCDPAMPTCAETDPVCTPLAGNASAGACTID